MALEDQVISGSEKIKIPEIPQISIRTITKIEENIAFYGISTPAGPVQLRVECASFVEGLNEGDKILVVKNGLKVIFAYGPLEESKSYTPERN